MAFQGGYVQRVPADFSVAVHQHGHLGVELRAQRHVAIDVGFNHLDAQSVGQCRERE